MLVMVNDKWLLKKYEPDSLVFKAYEFAQKAHKGSNRKDGSPYINHPLSVAKIINDWGFDDLTVCAALLHDVVEDTNYKSEDLKKSFGEEITFLVDGVTKIDTLKYNPGEEPDREKSQAENMRKLVVALAKDLRVIFIKLADRLHNMRTLGALSLKQQKRISAETIDIYATLAYRLGMQKLSGELEDLAFPYLYPRDFKWLRNQIEGRYEERKRYAKKVKPVLEDILNKEGIKPVKVDARAKRYFSLYQKLKRHDMQFDKIYDLVALRVIVEDVGDCYESLGVIHKYWPPMPGRIKDYIAMPKPNGYRSLHTTVFCLENKITEIQIRTNKMHEEAEMGAAAHWSYQQVRDSKKVIKGKSWKADEGEIEWVKQLRNWEKTFKGSEEFLKSLKIDFFKDRIFVVTPEHEVIDLPDGATPVDFAYHIHTEVGNQCVGAKVNNKIVPLDHKLCSGDVVEILTQKGKKPSESWLDFVKTAIARSKIRSAFRSKVNIFKSKHIEPKTTLRITIKDRPGVLKDITSVFSRNRINIESSQTQSHDKGNFGSIRITCKEIKGSKLEKILVKLKKIKGVNEVSYKQER
jgi:GTP diphosphokinase / guanosine-3',5'-bis(diphosphate) 3'-diphosphatase